MKIYNRIKQIGLQAAWLKFKQWLFSPSAEVIDLCARNGAYEYLQRYKYACKSKPNFETSAKAKIIWTCWWQGEENAPALVKKCISSMRQYAGENEVVVIDANNLQDYVSLPLYILEKHDKGIIKHTQFADIIRLSLLEKYGGCWIDATILLTDVLPDYIQNADIFCFSTDRSGVIKVESPFISSCAHHPVISDVLSLHYEYWAHENKLISYSIIHLFFTIAFESSELNLKFLENMPFVYWYKMDYLIHLLSKPYNENTYQLINKLSSIHKLTYKFEQYGVDITQKGTFYDVLINGNESC